MEITLEKVDLVIERTGVTYAEAKHALEVSNGEVLDAIIYIESIKEADAEANEKIKSESIEEFKAWLKDLISKDDKEIVNVPVNAGIAAGVIAIILPPVLAFVLIAAVVTKITVEITMADGSVEVVNKYISKAVDEIKDVATDVADKVKNKVDEVKKDMSNKDEYKVYKKSTINTSDENDNSFTYTVNFDEEE